MRNYIFTHGDKSNDLNKELGGKGSSLVKMTLEGLPVPEFFILKENSLTSFLKFNNLNLDDDNLTNKISKGLFPEDLKKEIEDFDHFWNISDSQDVGVSVRSSCSVEDSRDNSFAGQFETTLFLNNIELVLEAIKKSWISFIKLLPRIQSVDSPSFAVVVQKMIRSEKAGVLFTRNPTRCPLEKKCLITAVYGQGEGAVADLASSDLYFYDIDSKTVECEINSKDIKVDLNPDTKTLLEMPVEKALQDEHVLNEIELQSLIKLCLKFADGYSFHLDFEWAIANSKIYLLQARPITTLPAKSFEDIKVNGDKVYLWDNSNIVESFDGVTTPLTFSIARKSYDTVYKQTSRLMGVPEKIIKSFDDDYANMLGFIRGRIYYNLRAWYQLLILIPFIGSSSSFMETMMGVRKNLSKNESDELDFTDTIPNYTTGRKLFVFSKLIYFFYNLEKEVEKFLTYFNGKYDVLMAKKFEEESIHKLISLYKNWDTRITQKWRLPIVNDILVMIFFGIHEKLSEKWLTQKDQSLSSLSNDLLSGQGDVSSALPTKELMNIAGLIKNDNSLSVEKFLNQDSLSLWKDICIEEKYATIHKELNHYLYAYGFRCHNEQMLEGKDYFDKPEELIDLIKSFLKEGATNLEEMSARDYLITKNSMDKLFRNLKGFKRIIYLWNLKHTKRTIKAREEMRIARAKSYGANRRLFRMLGEKLASLEIISEPRDIFFLEIDELMNLASGNSTVYGFKSLVSVRKEYYEHFKKTAPPPERFSTIGLPTLSFLYPSVMNYKIFASGDESDDQGKIRGTSCCPGLIKGKVRIVKDITEAMDLSGDIILTYRTDPSWVPIFANCSGLIIQRGSLLSHSAIMAREMGIPTIVGVDPRAFDKFKTGDEIVLNATEGYVSLNE